MGDRVLGVLTAEHLYTTGGTRGTLGDVTSGRALSRYCTELGLERYLRMTAKAYHGKRYSRGDLVEALLGALYVDGGLEATTAFFDKLKRLFADEGHEPKGLLQEKLIEDGIDADLLRNELRYESLPKRRNDVAVHRRKIVLFGRTLATGEGSSHVEADQMAARTLLHSGELQSLVHRIQRDNK